MWPERYRTVHLKRRNLQQSTTDDVMQYQSIKFEIAGPVATITLHRPDAANAFNQELADELLNAAENCSENSEIQPLADNVN